MTIKKGAKVLIKGEIIRGFLEDSPERGYLVRTSKGAIMVNPEDLVEYIPGDDKRNLDVPYR